MTRMVCRRAGELMLKFGRSATLSSIRSSNRINLVVAIVPLFICLTILSDSAVAQLGGGRGFGGGLPGTGGGRKKELPKYRAPVFEHQIQGENVAAIKISGNREVPEEKIMRLIQSRVGEPFDPEIVQTDVRKLSTSGWFQNVRTYKKPVRGGVEITYEVFELPLIKYVRFVGNKKLSDKKLAKQAELKVGEAMHQYRVDEARRRVQEFYHERGYTEAEVEVQEGLGPNDRGIVFSVHEGKRQRIWKTKFVGATVVSPARLKALIESKPGILYVFQGQRRRRQD